MKKNQSLSPKLPKDQAWILAQVLQFFIGAAETKVFNMKVVLSLIVLSLVSLSSLSAQEVNADRIAEKFQMRLQGLDIPESPQPTEVKTPSTPSVKEKIRQIRQRQIVSRPAPLQNSQADMKTFFRKASNSLDRSPLPQLSQVVPGTGQKKHSYFDSSEYFESKGRATNRREINQP